MEDFDITGFVIFPSPRATGMKISDVGETHVYLVAMDGKIDQRSSTISIINGNFSGDDLSLRVSRSGDILNQLKIGEESQLFSDGETIPLISSVKIGWSKFTYTQKFGGDDWICNFRDLTNEGKKLYYSLRKLHNESEIRILTFNRIK
jgi:hypothetical protein